MDVADSINAFGQLKGWHLVAFLFAIVVIARPEWLRIVWLKMIGSKQQALKSKSDNSTDNNIANARLDEHEQMCDERRREMQEQLDRRFNSVDTEINGLRDEVKEMASISQGNSEGIARIEGYMKAKAESKL